MRTVFIAASITELFALAALGVAGTLYDSVPSSMQTWWTGLLGMLLIVFFAAGFTMAVSAEEYLR
jgi:quinol-cytochrome oxidoreductase complex cytochrome b subunit